MVLKKKAVTLMCGALLFISTPSYALFGFNEDPIEVEYENDYTCELEEQVCSNYYIYAIKSLESGVVIKNVSVNEGQCRAVRLKFNVPLNKKDYAGFATRTDKTGDKCLPRVVVISTNKGTYTFDF